MTIAPLPVAYNDSTHVRITLIDLDSQPAVVHFRQGHFDCASEDVPAMPYSSNVRPAGWVERAELNTAPVPLGVEDLAEIILAISNELQAHA